MPRTPVASDLHDAMTENGLKQVVLQAAYRNGWQVFTMAQAVPSRPNRGSGMGYPDLTLARDREVLWLELKAQDGKLSPNQLVWQDALPAFHVIRPSDWWSGRVMELLG